MRWTYKSDEVRQILERLKRKVIQTRRVPKKLLETNAYSENSPDRERAFGEVNVLNITIKEINEELEKLK